MSFNELSECEHAKALLSFRHYTKLLLEMRRDVEMAFRRISSIKHKLASQYPAAWSGNTVKYLLVLHFFKYEVSKLDFLLIL